MSALGGLENPDHDVGVSEYLLLALAPFFVFLPLPLFLFLGYRSHGKRAPSSTRRMIFLSVPCTLPHRHRPQQVRRPSTGTPELQRPEGLIGGGLPSFHLHLRSMLWRGAKARVRRALQTEVAHRSAARWGRACVAERKEVLESRLTLEKGRV